MLKRLLFKGKASALVERLKKESYLNKGWSVVSYIDNLASEERRAKAVFAGNLKEYTTRTATL